MKQSGTPGKARKQPGRPTAPPAVAPPPQSRPEAPPWHARPTLQLLLVLVVGLIAYSNTFSVPFIMDDADSIVGNTVVHDLGRFLSGEGYAYNPRRFIGYLTFALNYRFGGLDVFGYHLVNLVIHIGTGFLVYALAGLALRATGTRDAGAAQAADSKTLLPTPYSLLPLFAALIFVSHPIQTQAVTYIVQRLASLATFFYLASVVCYGYGRHWALGSGHWAKGEGKTSFSPFTLHCSPYPWYFLSLACALLAMGTKEIAATLPLAILLFEFTFFSRLERKKALVILIPLLATLFIIPVSLALTGKPMGELLSDASQLSRETTLIPRPVYLLTQIRVIATYLRLLVLPVNQNLDYDYYLYDSLFQGPVMASLLLIASLLGLAAWTWRKAVSSKKDVESSTSNDTLLPVPHSLLTSHCSLISFGLFWFFLTLLVESSVIPIADIIFEHRLYLPSVGFALAVASSVGLATGYLSRRAQLPVMAVIVIALTGATYMRNQVWQSELSLWQDAVSKAPGKARPHQNFSNALLRANRIDEGLMEARTAATLAPQNPELRNNLGALLETTGQLDKASMEYQTAVSLKPDFVVALVNLGAVRQKMGDAAGAEAAYQKALALQPVNLHARNNLCGLLLTQGKIDAATRELKKLLAVNPLMYEALCNLALAYEVQGLQHEAVSTYQKAIQARPNDADGYLKLGTALQKQGDFPAAITAYQEALKIKPDMIKAHLNIGIAYLRHGDRAHATEHLLTVQNRAPGEQISRDILATLKRN